MKPDKTSSLMDNELITTAEAAIIARRYGQRQRKICEEIE